MTLKPSQCQNLESQVTAIFQLLEQEPTLRSHFNTSAIATSLRKVLSPRFEVVFGGAFSAGKSMLINALLDRELLYSAEGHATGTQCAIAYPEPGQGERVVLTFLSRTELQEQLEAVTQRLGLTLGCNLFDRENLKSHLSSLGQTAQAILLEEGGESKSDRGKQARALQLLAEGIQVNDDRLADHSNAVYSMEQFNFADLKEAATYARRGSNSAVLKRIEYYCEHPLLEDGNVLVDMPGIDAPVKRDADLTYRKIEDPETSAVICVLKPAAAGDMTREETELLEKMRENPGIRDRVFYVFNRIDETWYNSQLRQRLDDLIQKEFYNTNRVYKTSALLGFYGHQISQSTSHDRFGLDSIFAESIHGEDDTPQFVSEFNRYCANSGKLSPSKFRVSVNSYETPQENYVRILAEQGLPLIQQLMQDSGVENFRSAITRYLKEEKWPELFSNLAADLEPLCILLKDHYQAQRRDLESQPQEIESMKSKEMERLNQDLQAIGQDFKAFMTDYVNRLIINEDSPFEADFNKLKARMVSRLDELLHTFSVTQAYSYATRSHPRNATAPLIAVLVEALYWIANELEFVLVEAVQGLTENMMQRLLDELGKTDFYRKLYRLVDGDGGIGAAMQFLQGQLLAALVSEARTECDRYVRESPRFYDEGTFSIYHFRQTLLQTSQGFDCESMVAAEPAIRQLLKLDFEPKVNETIRRNFRQTVNQTLKTHLLPLADRLANDILQQYDRARDTLQLNLEQEAAEKIQRNQRSRQELQQKIEVYNTVVGGINLCLESMDLVDRVLPLIS